MKEPYVPGMPFTPFTAWTPSPEDHHVTPNGKYTETEQARIRTGDAYDPEDCEVSDEIINRGPRKY